MLEASLYPAVERFIRTELECFTVSRTPGTRYGTIDIVGLRYSMGRLGGTSEVVAVEVKRGTSQLLKSLGQATGYSLMADRCYLALRKTEGPISAQEKEMAAQLNLGLIEITGRGQCRLMLSSPQHRPLRAHKLALIRRVGFGECALCGKLCRRTLVATQTKRTTITNAIRAAKAFRYEVKTSAPDGDSYASGWRYLCEDCVQAFRGLASSG